MERIYESACDFFPLPFGESAEHALVGLLNQILQNFFGHFAVQLYRNPMRLVKVIAEENLHSLSKSAWAL